MATELPEDVGEECGSRIQPCGLPREIPTCQNCRGNAGAR
jgi:hypothetical protein